MPVIFAFYPSIVGGAFPFTVPAQTLLVRVFALTWAPILLGVALRSIRFHEPPGFSVLFRSVCASGVVALCIYICITRANQLTNNLRTNVTVSAGLILGTRWYTIVLPQNSNKYKLMRRPVRAADRYHPWHLCGSSLALSRLAQPPLRD